MPTRATAPSTQQRAAAPSRSTRQGAAVEGALRAQDGFRSAQEIYTALRSAGQNVGLSTVYRHLQAFAEQGLADVIHTAEGETAYRLCDLSADRKHHHHLVCRDCGRAEEIEARAIERWSKQVATTHGYAEVDHTVEIFGVCPDCAA
nr:Fur family transcriptional regulator [Actinopolymorpha pittospori]